MIPPPDSLSDRFHTIRPSDEFHPEGERLPGGRFLLSPAKVRTFLNVMSRWEIDDDDACRLLGGMSKRAHLVFKEGGTQILDRDTRRRIYHLLDFSEMLNSLYSRRMSGKWMQNPIPDEPFAGKTPLGFLREGDLPEFQAVQRFLEAQMEIVDASRKLLADRQAIAADGALSSKSVEISAIAGSIHDAWRKLSELKKAER